MKKHFFTLVPIAVMLLFIISCSKDDDGGAASGLNRTDITLYASEEFKLTYSGGSCVWSSDNDLIAKVENGVVTAKHVGTTLIHANNSTCQVTVIPRYMTYTEPCLLWGASKSKVINFMASYTLRGEETNSLVYEGKGKVRAYAYIFENGGLKASGLFITLLNSVDLADFLLERYVVLDMKEESDGTLNTSFVSPDLNTYILNSIDKDGVLVTYFSAKQSNSSTSRSISDIDCTKLMRQAMEKFK